MSDEDQGAGKWRLNPKRLRQMLEGHFVDAPAAERRELVAKLNDLPGLTRTGIEADHFYSYYRLGVVNAREGAHSFDSFCNRMVRDLGDVIWPYLGLLWNAVWQENRGLFDDEARQWPHEE